MRTREYGILIFMQVLLVILSLGLLGLIIYFAVSPKSSRLLRICALAALGLIALSLGICGIFLIRGPVEKAVEIPFPVLGESGDEPEKKSNVVVILVFFVILILIMGLIVLIGFRDRLKPSKKAPEPDALASFKDDIPDLAIRAGDDDDDDETFDIGLDENDER